MVFIIEIFFWLEIMFFRWQFPEVHLFELLAEMNLVVSFYGHIDWVMF